MTQESEAGKFQRLEDFIALAKQGEKVTVGIALRKQLVQEKVHPEGTSDMRDAIGMYLLLADYSLSAKDETRVVSKVYAFGSAEESLDATRVNKSIANERLRMDYRRLKDAGVAVPEKFF
jgi:hypothetical protein